MKQEDRQDGRLDVLAAYTSIITFLSMIDGTFPGMEAIRTVPWTGQVDTPLGRMSVHALRERTGFRPPDSWSTDDTWNSAWQLYRLRAIHSQDVPPAMRGGHLPPWKLDQGRSCEETPWMDDEGNIV